MATALSLMPAMAVKSIEDELIGSNAGLRRTWSSVKMVARTDSAVLIQGETGTGRNSSPGPFMRKACAGPPRS